MLALRLGQHHAGGNPIQHGCRGSAAAALLEPRVPGGTDIGSLRGLLPAQSRGTPATGGDPEASRIKPGAAIAKIRSQRIRRSDWHGYSVDIYTTIRSLL
ncbi:hypothetical protein G6F65_018637 [Rhizopus arrhizus]|nr:hypothetical protein G6F65_018637 [Rhizopus arrhizus]